MTNQYRYYRTDVTMLKKQIAEDVNFIDLQDKVDTGDFENIYQTSYKNISLFGDSTVAATGCGYIATVIALSCLGENVDVHDVYMQINRSGNEFFNTGAVSASAVSECMMSYGYYPVGASFDMIPNGVYITYYSYVNKDGNSVWHFLSFTTDNNKHITCYNTSIPGGVSNYGELAEEKFIYFRRKKLYTIIGKKSHETFD